jgi:flagellar protein FlaG
MNVQPMGSAATVKADDRGAAIPAKTTPATGATAAAGVQGATAAAGTAEPSAQQLASAVDKINKSLQASSQNIEFSIDTDSKRTIVKVVDQSTKEVLRQIPTAEALEIAKSIDKMRGLLISNEA